MQPEPAIIDPFNSAPVDFSVRAAPHQLPEWMDEPCSFEQFRACLQDLGQVNRVTLSYRPTLDFLNRIVKQRERSEGIHTSSAQRVPLRIVDVGSGGGDTLRVIERWAKHRNVRVTLTGVDLNPYAARAAREFTPAGSQIRWITADALAPAQSEGVDVVISSLFTHHLEELDIVRFVAWMERVANCGWFINDLLRSRKAFMVFRVLSRAARWHSFVQHDGPASIRRGFREQDWQNILAQAGVPLEACGLESWFPGRLCVSRCK